MQRLEIIKKLLLDVSKNVFHYEAPNGQKGDYIVYQEDGEGKSFSSDNRKECQSITGTINLFSFDEHCGLFDLIQKKLNENSISFAFVDASYDADTRLINWQWDFEV